MRAAVGLPSVAEQAELALDAEKRRSTGGQVGMFDMYQRSAAAANKESQVNAKSFVDSFRQDASAPTAAVTATPAKPAESSPLNLSVGARFAKKKSRG